MRFLNQLTANEKAGLGILIVLLPVYGVARWVLPSLLFATVVWALLIFISAVVALFCLVGPPYQDQGAWRTILGRFLPAIALAATLSVQVAAAKIDHLAFAARHSAELSGRPPQGVIYAEGIPDGGQVIVRSPGRNPATLLDTVGIRLTGERIKSCERMDEELWFCHFD